MLINVALLIAAMAVILVAAEFFTNAVEWLGKKLNLGEGAVGSVLAAVGTALPETVLPIIAMGLIRSTAPSWTVSGGNSRSSVQSSATRTRRSRLGSFSQ